MPKLNTLYHEITEQHRHISKKFKAKNRVSSFRNIHPSKTCHFHPDCKEPTFKSFLIRKTIYKIPFSPKITTNMVNF